MKNLLKKALTGDKDAENQIFEILLDRFVTLAKRRVGETAAGDLAQKACLIVLEKYKTGHPRDDFEAWAYTVLRNVIGNYYQSRKTRRKFFATDDDVSPSTVSTESDTEKVRHLRECFRVLIREHPRYARVLNLSHQGFETKEICAKLSIRPENLYNILNRGRKMLRDLLQKGSNESI